MFQKVAIRRNNRRLMKQYQLLYGVLLFLCFESACASSAAHFFVGDSIHSPQRPNVIIILTDDQGYGDLSCHGNPILKTPALDKLYSESIRLDNFHATPLCTPTRGQLMTGLDAMNNRAATVAVAPRWTRALL